MSTEEEKVIFVRAAKEKTFFKFVALSNGERAAGIPPSNISIEVSIDDVGFEDFRSEFVDDFKKFIKTWMDGARIYTQEEVDKLSREEHEGDDSVPSAYRHIPGAADICTKCGRERWMHGTRHDTCTRFQSEE
jgi:hypothetical protein